jgi:glyoxylase-like metal-dependent hydrolase (beta-lactamase superfamily II)
VHTGDIVFYPGYPFIDVSCGGSIDGVIAAVEAVLKVCDEKTRIVPGHGPVMNRDQLEEYKGMLRAFRNAVAKEIEGGKDLAAIQSARPTSKLDEQWGRYHFPPERFTEIVYRSLLRK